MSGNTCTVNTVSNMYICAWSLGLFVIETGFPDFGGCRAWKTKCCTGIDCQGCGCESTAKGYGKNVMLGFEPNQTTSVCGHRRRIYSITALVCGVHVRCYVLARMVLRTCSLFLYVSDFRAPARR